MCKFYKVLNLGPWNWDVFPWHRKLLYWHQKRTCSILWCAPPNMLTESTLNCYKPWDFYTFVEFCCWVRVVNIDIYLYHLHHLCDAKFKKLKSLLDCVSGRKCLFCQQTRGNDMFHTCLMCSSKSLATQCLIRRLW